MALYDSFDYMTKKQNVLWMGKPGCGKTGLATGFLLQAIDRGYRGSFVSFPELVGELYASVADHSQAKVLRKYASYDCLLIEDATESYFPNFKQAALAMIAAQGGIVGWTAPFAALEAAVTEQVAS